jgi:hypothetical protein
MDPTLTYITATAYIGLATILLLSGTVGRFPVFTLYLAAKGSFLLLAWAPGDLTRVVVSELGFPALRWLVILETFWELAFWMNARVARYALVFLGVFSLNGGVFALVQYSGTPVIAAFRMARQMFAASAALFIFGWLVTYWYALRQFGDFRRADVIHLVILAVYIVQFPIEGMVDRIAQIDRDVSLWRMNNQVSFVVNLVCIAAWAIQLASNARTARSRAAICTP